MSKYKKGPVTAFSSPKDYVLPKVVYYEYDFRICKASKIAVIIISKCREKGYNIDLIKLQQILTLMQGTMLARYNRPLFAADIYNLETPIIKEVHKDMTDTEISGIANNFVAKGFWLESFLSDEEISVVEEILERFGIYNCDYLKTTFVLNVLDKIRSEKESIVPIEYLKMLFIEFGFNIPKNNKQVTDYVKESDGEFISFTEKYSDLISTDFPKKWLADPETGYVPPKHDLSKMADTIAENGFVERYCLDEDDVKQLRLIRHYRKNYIQQN